MSLFGSAVFRPAAIAAVVSIAELAVACVKLIDHDPAARSAACDAARRAPPDWFRYWCEANAGCELAELAPAMTGAVYPPPAAVAIMSVVAAVAVFARHVGGLSDSRVLTLIIMSAVHVGFAVVLGVILPTEPCAFGPWLTAAAVAGLVWCVGATVAFGSLEAERFP
jgi:hypothetical protein